VRCSTCARAAARAASVSAAAAACASSSLCSCAKRQACCVLRRSSRAAAWLRKEAAWLSASDLTQQQRTGHASTVASMLAAHPSCFACTAAACLHNVSVGCWHPFNAARPYLVTSSSCCRRSAFEVDALTSTAASAAVACVSVRASFKEARCCSACSYRVLRAAYSCCVCSSSACSRSYGNVVKQQQKMTCFGDFLSNPEWNTARVNQRLTCATGVEHQAAN
jgi:hypothetical protein